MTDRVAGFIVTLADDRREDDVAAIVTALRMVSGVASVEPVPADYQLHIATDRARHELRAKVAQLLHELDDPGTVSR